MCLCFLVVVLVFFFFSNINLYCVVEQLFMDAQHAATEN